MACEDEGYAKRGCNNPPPTEWVPSDGIWDAPNAVKFCSVPPAYLSIKSESVSFSNDKTIFRQDGNCCEVVNVSWQDKFTELCELCVYEHIFEGSPSDLKCRFHNGVNDDPDDGYLEVSLIAINNTVEDASGLCKTSFWDNDGQFIKNGMNTYKSQCNDISCPHRAEQSGMITDSGTSIDSNKLYYDIDSKVKAIDDGIKNALIDQTFIGTDGGDCYQVTIGSGGDLWHYSGRFHGQCKNRTFPPNSKHLIGTFDRWEGDTAYYTGGVRPGKCVDRNDSTGIVKIVLSGSDFTTMEMAFDACVFNATIIVPYIIGSGTSFDGSQLDADNDSTIEDVSSSPKDNNTFGDSP